MLQKDNEQAIEIRHKSLKAYLTVYKETFISCMRKAEKDDQVPDPIVSMIECQRWLTCPVKAHLLCQI